jgi:hypothetical protein
LSLRFVVALEATLLVALAATMPGHAHACTCVQAEAALLTPDRGGDVPANTKVRVELPRHRSNADVVLRVHRGAVVATKSTSFPDHRASVVELTPLTPLAPSTRYEVVAIERDAHPPNHVFATFETSAAPALDTTPPKIVRTGSVAHAEPFKLARPGGTCAASGPWVVVRDVVATDPGRPDAHLVYAVWLGDASGKVDGARLPTRILLADDGVLAIGSPTVCHHQGFPFSPAHRVVWLAIAAVDEAGNQSAVEKVRVEFPPHDSPATPP